MATTRWVRCVVPVMVEIDCDNDAIDRIVALPGEAREDRDDRGVRSKKMWRGCRDRPGGSVPGADAATVAAPQQGDPA
jgi:hypothetical protein